MAAESGTILHALLGPGSQYADGFAVTGDGLPWPCGQPVFKQGYLAWRWFSAHRVGTGAMSGCCPGAAACHTGALAGIM